MSAERRKHPAHEAPGDGAAEAHDEALAVDQTALLSQITEERDKLTAEKAELQDRNLRTQAEFQNLRRRVEKERLEFHTYAAEEAIRSLLPVLDDFQRALRVEHASSDYAKGVELIYQRLFDALKKLGLEPIVSVGATFDPHVHHAVEKHETADTPEGVVLEDYQPGYNFKGRLLRPAMVKVAVAPSGAEAKAERD